MEMKLMLEDVDYPCGQLVLAQGSSIEELLKDLADFAPNWKHSEKIEENNLLLKVFQSGEVHEIELSSIDKLISAEVNRQIFVHNPEEVEYTLNVEYKPDR